MFILQLNNLYHKKCIFCWAFSDKTFILCLLKSDFVFVNKGSLSTQIEWFILKKKVTIAVILLTSSDAFFMGWQMSYLK